MSRQRASTVAMYNISCFEWKNKTYDDLSLIMGRKPYTKIAPLERIVFAYALRYTRWIRPTMYAIVRENAVLLYEHR